MSRYSEICTGLLLVSLANAILFTPFVVTLVLFSFIEGGPY